MSSDKKESVEVVVFEKRRGKKGFGQVVKIKKKDEDDDSSKDPKEFDFRKARHDVFKFGVAGLDTASKLDAKVAQAVRLGARVSLLIHSPTYFNNRV